VESIRGSGPAGSVILTEFDAPHSSRQGPLTGVPINTLIGSSLKRSQARTAVGIGGVLSMIEGVSGNYPVHFRKQVDNSSPFLFQAATDFAPYGTWRYANASERPCPHLFNFEFVVVLPQIIGTRLELHLNFVDSIITDLKMQLPPFSSTSRVAMVEDVYFMYRGLVYSLYESGSLIESGSFTDGFRDVRSLPIFFTEDVLTIPLHIELPTCSNSWRSGGLL